MNKTSFFMLLTLALASSCSKVEEQNSSKTAKLDVPQVETQAQLEATASKTEDLALPQVVAKAEKPKENNMVTRKKEAISFFQQAQEMIQEAVTPNKNEENATILTEKETYLYDETAIGKYFAQAMTPSQVLTVTPSLLEAVTVKGKEGTVITLPPASLVDEEGKPVTKPVQIELKECYQMKDILASNLTTTCSDMTLQTGGMVYINATADGKTLRLLPTHPILVEMPTKDKQEDMELFYGEKRPVSGVMNWRVADTKKKRRNLAENLPQQNQNTITTMQNNWESFGESVQKYEVGEIELAVNLKGSKDLDGKPTVSFEVKNIHPKLEKYKAIIAETLNKVTWENDEESKAKHKTLYEYNQYCLLGGVMFADLKELLKIRDEISKYKNYSFKKKIPLQAHLDKNLYYKKVGLLNRYVLDKAAWAADKKFFEQNFERVKGQKNNFYDNVLEELEANKEAVMNAYTAHYALSYLFTVNQMGWLNCDRFDPTAGERTDLMVKYDSKKDTDIKLILPENNSVIPGRDLGKMVGFGNLVKGTKGILIGTKMMNDIPFFCFKEVILGAEKNVSLTGYKQMSMAEFEAELKKYGLSS